MNHEKILDALEFIDDDMIERVDVLRKSPERPRLLWLKYVSVAACVMLAIFGGFKYFDSHFATQENSSTGDDLNNIQSGVIDIYGDTNYKDESAEQLKTDDNTNGVDESTEFRDEFAGSTSGSACFAASVYMEVIEITDNSFKGKVLEKVVVGTSTHFEENQIVTVIYSESTNENLDTIPIKDLSVGEKVYVFYGKIESGTIYTPRIQYEKF